jgi:hypothetical protein
MPLVRGIDLPGAHVRYRTGYDGWEPVEVLRRGQRLPEDRIRVAVAIQGSYPDLCDVYTNAALIGLVQDALRFVGLHVVLEEMHQVRGLVPEEEPCALRREEEYLLVQEDLAVLGSVLVWSFSWSFGGSFYGESNPIVDAILPGGLFSAWASSLRDLCAQHDIACEEVAGAERTSAKFLRRGFVRALSRKLKAWVVRRR